MVPTIQNDQDLTANIIALSANLAVTNQNLATLNRMTASYERLLHGEGLDGGLISRVREDHAKLEEDHKILTDPESGLVAQLIHLTQNCEKVVASVATQDASLKRLNRIMTIVAGIVIFLVATVGIADFKSVLSAILALV